MRKTLACTIGVLCCILQGATHLEAQTVSVDFIYTQDTMSNLSGYNLAGMHGIFKCSYNAPQNGNGYEFIKDLDPKLLRFPGGLISQYSHLLQGPGYGLDSLELVTDFTGAELMGFMQQYQVEQTIPCRYIDMFLTMYNDLPTSNVEVLFVANISTATEQENLTVLNYLISNNVNVVGVELGNECYRDQVRFPNVTAYLNSAQPYAQAINNTAPDLKLGWVAAPPLTANLDIFSPTFQSHIYNWNSGLSSQQANPLVDAFIVHLYVNSYYPGTALSYQNNYDNDDLSTLNAPFNYATTELHRYIQDSLQRVIFEYQSYLGSSTKLWVTEWGPSKPSVVIGNTVLDAMFGFMWTDRMHVMNAQINNQIEYACKHKLAGPNTNAANMLSPKGSIDDTPYEYVRRSSYWAAFLQKTMADVDLTVTKSVSNTSTLPLPVHIEGFIQQNGEFRMNFANCNPQQATLDLNDVRIFLADGTPVLFTPNTSIVLDWMNGSQIYSSAGSTEFLVDNVNFNSINMPTFELDTITHSILSSTTQTFTLPAYSLGSIRFGAQFVLGVDESEGVATALHVFPNPAKAGEEIIMGLDANAFPQGLTVSVMDLYGNEVEYLEQNATTGTFLLNTESWASGVYFIRVKARGGDSTSYASKKLVLLK